MGRMCLYGCLLLIGLIYAQIVGAQSRIVTGPPNSTFNYHHLADSCSKRGDSASASKYFLQIDPYYFMSYWNATPDSLTSVYSDFSITNYARLRYRKIFDSVYRKPRSKVFKQLAQIYREDQAIRYKLDSVGDGIPLELRARMMRTIDSPHFEMLYQYVKNYGWPALKDGSLYAEMIVVHDHERHAYYLPIVEQAVKDGMLSESTYRVIYNYYRRTNTDWEYILNSPNKVSFDVTSAINFVTPDTATLRRIANAIKEHCPLGEIFWIYESGNPKDANVWFDEHVRNIKKNKDIFSEVVGDAQSLNCRAHANSHVRHRLTSGKAKRMVLYLVY